MVIELDSVEVSYPAASGSEPVRALESVDLGIGEAEFTAIIGPSGAGKTTLFRTITGFVRPSAGRVAVNGLDPVRATGRQLRALRRRLAIVHQEYNLVERVSALQNVLLGRLGYVNPALSLFGCFPRADRQRALDALTRLGMAGRAGHRLDRLSGGERQRVALARALVQEPAAILADEPAANLDMALTELLLDRLQMLNRREGLTVVLNLHDVDLARRYASRVVALRAGCVVFDGAPQGLDTSWLEAIYERSPEPEARAGAA